MLRERRVRSIPIHKLNLRKTNEKMRLKNYRYKCTKQPDRNDFLGMKRFNDKSYSCLSKFIRILVITFCFTGALIQISMRVEAFLEDAVVIEVKLTQRTSVIFPSITICDLNLIMIILKLNESKSNDDINTNQFWFNQGIDPADILITRICAHALTETCAKPVTEEMMVESVNTMLGRCIMLTMKSKMDFKGQNTYAIFTWQEIKTLNNNDTDNIGVYFFLHQDTFHHAYDGFPLMEFAKAGYSTGYRIYSKKLQNLNTYQNPCVPEEIYHACLNDCINKIMIEKSSCGLPFVNNSNLKQCTSIKEIRQNILRMFPIWFNMTSHFKKCACQRKCIEMQFVSNRNEKTKLESNNTKLGFLYAGDKDELIREKKMLTAAGLFSEIGGTLGLYLGISVVAIVDFLENVIRYSLKHFKHL